MSNKSEHKNEIVALLKSKQVFYVAGHTSPDGDAIGSSFGLGLALEKLGKTVYVILEDYHSRYNIIPGRHLLYSGKITETTIETDAVFICMDCASITRLSEPVQQLAKQALANKTLVCVDHHFSNDYFASHNFVDITASSTCELVYRLLDGFVELDKNIAAAVYSGMVSDTGGFRNATTGEETLEAASHLIAIGIPFTQIYTALINLRTFTELKLLARVLDVCERTEDAAIVYACVTTDMMKNLEGAADATIQDLEGVVEYLINIRHAQVSLLIYERAANEVKMSMRSKEINVGEIAQKFGGGGHKLAAAAIANCSVHELRDRVIPVIQAALRNK